MQLVSHHCAKEGIDIIGKSCEVWSLEPVDIRHHDDLPCEGLLVDANKVEEAPPIRVHQARMVMNPLNPLFVAGRKPIPSAKFLGWFLVSKSPFV